MCEKVEKYDPYMILRRLRILLHFIKIPKVLLPLTSCETHV
jgi:hypothetical protein